MVSRLLLQLALLLFLGSALKSCNAAKINQIGSKAVVTWPDAFVHNFTEREKTSQPDTLVKSNYLHHIPKNMDRRALLNYMDFLISLHLPGDFPGAMKPWKRDPKWQQEYLHQQEGEHNTRELQDEIYPDFEYELDENEGMAENTEIKRGDPGPASTFAMLNPSYEGYHRHQFLGQTGLLDEEPDFSSTVLPPSPSIFRRITLIQMRMSPFTHVVRLSCGCSGTLVTPRHVLTSAHCVHDGSSLKVNIRALKVELAESMGFRMHYVETIYVPNRFQFSSGLPDAERAAWDYAVITLSSHVPGRRDFMRFQALSSTTWGLLHQVNFVGYPKSKYPWMWRSSCGVHRSGLVQQGHFLLTSCNASPGMAGAAVIVAGRRPSDRRAVVGVVTKALTSSDSRPERRVSALLVLTEEKVRDTCARMQPEASQYRVC